MERKLVINGFYRHFKDKLYQVKGTAIHSETKEKMVIYQGLYGDYEMYVRPYDMFLSEVDHVKYPDVKQKYRFELIDIKTGMSLETDAVYDSKESTVGYSGQAESTQGISERDGVYNTDSKASELKETESLDITAEMQKKDIVTGMSFETDTVYNSKENSVGYAGRIEKTNAEEEPQEESKLIRFLDAYDYKEKLDILTSMRSELNDGLIDIMAESIEVAVPEGDITDRYNSLRKCLMAHTKYEGLRLRQ